MLIKMKLSILFMDLNQIVNINIYLEKIHSKRYVQYVIL